MGKLIEDVSLRDKILVFKDRDEAGRLLAERLVKYKDSNGIIFGIPSGGVPIAREISIALNLPVDLIIARKIQIPYNPEAGFGAMGPDEETVFNKRLLNQIGLTEDEVSVQTKKTMSVVKKRNDLFRGDKPYPSLKDKTIIITDDGLASGYTMLAAVRFVKKTKPEKVVVAVPTGSKNTVDFILHEVDELVCLNVRGGYSFAVAEAYRNWYDMTDEEVISIIRQISRRL